MQCCLITDSSIGFILLQQLDGLAKYSVNFLLATFLYFSFVGVLC